MAFPNLLVGPMDPDSSSELTKGLQSRNKVDQLLKKHGANYPEALTVALARPIDVARTEHIDYEELEEYLRGVTGRRAFFREGDTLLEDGASVRQGRKDEDRPVALIFVSGKSGRTARAIVPYSDLPKSISAYEDAQDAAKQAESGEARVVTVTDEVAVAEAAEKADAAEKGRLEAETARVEAENRLAELEERLTKLEEPEPYEGYDDENADVVVAYIKERGLAEMGSKGLSSLANYESAHKKRSSVVRAAEDAIAAA